MWFYHYIYIMYVYIYAYIRYGIKKNGLLYIIIPGLLIGM